jgi:hypothetical protein
VSYGLTVLRACTDTDFPCHYHLFWYSLCFQPLSPISHLQFSLRDHKPFIHFSFVISLRHAYHFFHNRSF